MCGILGTINVEVDDEILNLLAHRGPDDSGIERASVGSFEVYFGQRRLSIVDLSPAGHQPMNSPCGRYSLIYNGELYNHQDLRDELPATIDYRGHSDTETILHYLIAHGIEGVRAFNGIFALGFLDREAKTLQIARDPFGVKPLYYCQPAGSNKLAFASEMRPLQAILGNTTLNKDALATLLRLRYNPAPDTLYTQIDKVRPGHYLHFDLGGEQTQLREVPYLAPLPTTRVINENEAVAGYGGKIAAAVERQLLADVEVGILLSGGVDSAIVAALAQEKSTTPLKAFTIGFRGEHQEDEINDAAETAALLGLEHHVKRIDFTDFLGTMRECVRIVEEPLATTSIIPMYYLAELAAQHVKVVLTGQGADEPLGGYVRYKSELLREKIPRVLRAPVAAALGGISSRNEKVSRGAAALAETDEIARFLAAYQVFTPSEISGLIGTEDKLSKPRIAYFYELLGCQNRPAGAERMMALDTRLNLADDLLNYTDKVTMNFSLECRVPMLDLELVRYIESLPAANKLNLRGGKLIHKQYARERLPANIINRKKKGFQSPTQLWFRDGATEIQSLLLDDSSAFGKVFHLPAVREIITQHQTGYNREKQIFLLLSIYFWLDTQAK
ncbi:asparagine synthase (glutamine-hydrolyzing) [Neolewinella antarctica]|uniref:asparagine synthase (glutamine-hydrolyzing) n=1 Tax=Neolewinella antarctica TaxID=442734 RepID=A0ABX0XAM5_9BACT|nr:asparagine synthase (glutamine-hydrolyzing) [Neolewinella antarctica]NJC25878.1 asparagine synthase (glutamine-hydrolysing) [Neolewinella antarctica]